MVAGALWSPVDNDAADGGIGTATHLWFTGVWDEGDSEFVERVSAVVVKVGVPLGICLWQAAEDHKPIKCFRQVRGE